MLTRKLTALTLGTLTLAVGASSASAINIVFDYRYDSAGFFDTGTSNGALARASLEAAGSFFSTLILDSLDAIPYADPTTPGGSNTPVWRQVIKLPSTGASYSISSAANAGQDGLGAADEYRDIQIAADEYLIYAGGSAIAGSTAGIGGTGVSYFGGAPFNANVAQRGKPTGEYSTWGGYILMDNDDTTWHYDHTTSVASGKTDLYSVALHELGHVLGLNTSATEFTDYRSGATWTGPEALAAWNADNGTSLTSIPLESASNTHWKNGAVFSNIWGTSTSQEAAMDPSITTGTRKLFTNVDVYELADIGWTIPEPTSLAMLSLAGLLVLRRRRVA